MTVTIWQIGSLGVSSFLVIISFSTLMYTICHQNKIDKKNNERLEREQAAKISTWVFNEKESIFTINNASDTPVYNVFLLCHSNNDSTYIESFLADNQMGYQEYRYIEILSPGNKTEAFQKMGRAMGNEHQVTSMFFTDAQNIQWIRKANGFLEKKEYMQEASKNGRLLKHV